MPRGRGLDPIALMNKRSKKTLNSILKGGVKAVKVTQKAYKTNSRNNKRSLADDALRARAIRIYQSKQNFYNYYRKGDLQNALLHLKEFEPNVYIDNIEKYYLKCQRDERVKMYLVCGMFAFIAVIIYLIVR